MKKDFILPDIGEGIVECEIVEWLIKEGDVLAEDQPVCDVMTDKALVQIPAKYAGKVVKLHYAKGEIAKVHSPLFQQEIAGASSSAPTAVAAPVVAEAVVAGFVTATDIAVATIAAPDFLATHFGQNRRDWRQTAVGKKYRQPTPQAAATTRKRMTPTTTAFLFLFLLIRHLN